ncbi:DUF4258 domain-containing protein [Zhongshania sp.]|jgi:hypothetical protein|uniref:DUF4258 domain-containing protein n=1 Tax=Zhongshania sp. TaxID=1971902 RepID=UPI0039E5A381
MKLCAGNLIISYHAEKRMRQRCISQFTVDTLLEYGEIDFHQGKECYYFSTRSKKKLIQDYGNDIGEKILQEVSDYYCVAANDTIVTVARKLKHFKRNR